MPDDGSVVGAPRGSGLQRTPSRTPCGWLRSRGEGGRRRGRALHCTACCCASRISHLAPSEWLSGAKRARSGPCTQPGARTADNRRRSSPSTVVRVGGRPRALHLLRPQARAERAWQAKGPERGRGRVGEWACVGPAAASRSNRGRPQLPLRDGGMAVPGCNASAWRACRTRPPQAGPGTSLLQRTLLRAALSSTARKPWAAWHLARR